MTSDDFQLMSIDDLWALRDDIGAMLIERINSEKHNLEDRLDQLGQRRSDAVKRERRPYPKVHPKFLNPFETSQTWSGRGQKPRWVIELLETGKTMNDLRIEGRLTQAEQASTSSG